MRLRFPKQIDLPLLGKELIEQAARKRTYVIRVAYAVILFLMSILFFYQILAAASKSPLAALGKGKEIIVTLVGLQFAGVYFFMPAMTCSVITQEKERASLQLLFLTRLGPWTILFEKLLGRMVPMLGFLLLSVPLLGFAYTLGGVSPRALWTGILMLVIATIQMGTLALMCSAFCRTTVGSFMSSYVLAFMLFFGPYFLCMMLMMVFMLLGYLFHFEPGQVMSQIFGRSNEGVMFLVMFPFFGPPIYFLEAQAPGIFGHLAVAAHTVINLGVSGGFLLLARRFLVARAFVPHRNILLQAFRSFDRKRPKPAAVASGASPAPAVVFSDDALLPADEPIVWRETNKRMLGSRRYILRVLLFVEIPVILFCGLMAIFEIYARRYDATEIVAFLSAPMHFLMWTLAVLVVSVKSASLIAGERSHQTLDVLCTTPLTGREIVTQKMRGIWRVILVTSVPFFTVFLFKAWRLEAIKLLGTPRMGRSVDFDPLVYLVCQALSVGILLPLVAWLSLLIGLKVKTQGRAIMGSMAALLGWCIGPLVFIGIPTSIIVAASSNPRSYEKYTELALLLSPATTVFMNEIVQLDEFEFGAWGTMAINFTIYGVLLVWVRRVCLVHADRWLGRLEAEGVGATGHAEETGARSEQRAEALSAH